MTFRTVPQPPTPPDPQQDTGPFPPQPWPPVGQPVPRLVSFFDLGWFTR